MPSGRFSYALVAPSNTIVAGGDTPSALTDVRDVGVYVAKIITDPRTLNKKVFAFTETKTQNQVFELVQKMSGEKPIGSEVKQPTPAVFFHLTNTCICITAVGSESEAKSGGTHEVLCDQPSPGPVRILELVGSTG